MEGPRVGLELKGASLLDRPVAVRLKPELRDEKGLRRIAGAEGIQERTEGVSVVGRSSPRVVPPEVLIEADRVERPIRRLASNARPQADCHTHGASWVKAVCERGGTGDPGRFGAIDGRVQLVSDAPE